MAIPDLSAVPAIPLDEDGAVFKAPWEARIFSLIVSLHNAGFFDWSEWTTAISGEIAADQGRDPETPYYELWLRAAETLIDAKGLCTRGAMQSARDAILNARH